MICKPRPRNSGEVKRMQAEETTSKRPREVNKTGMLENQKEGQCGWNRVKPGEVREAERVQFVKVNGKCNVSGNPKGLFLFI